MNLISNDCIGAYLYRDCFKTEYKNPFIWSSINIDNFLILYEFYDRIDFSSYKCDVVVNNSGICKQNSLIPKIIIDNKVEVNYFHYIQDEKYNQPTRNDGYTLINDVKGYAIDCYKERLNLMNETPIFIWDVTSCKWYNKSGKNPVSVFNKISDKYQLIIYSDSVKTDINGRVTTLYKTNGSFEVNVSANNIYNKIFNKT